VLLLPGLSELRTVRLELRLGRRRLGKREAKMRRRTRLRTLLISRSRLCVDPHPIYRRVKFCLLEEELRVTLRKKLMRRRRRLSEMLSPLGKLFPLSTFNAQR